MVAYEFYSLSANEKIVALAKIVRCNDDLEAIARAQQLFDGRTTIEVWRLSRRVIRVSSIQSEIQASLMLAKYFEGRAKRCKNHKREQFLVLAMKYLHQAREKEKRERARDQ
jgi:hypothetical protein